MLFKDDFERIEGRKTSGERMFEFLQRMNRPEAERICQWANGWFEDLPSYEKSKFENRLKTRVDHQFIDALFEMQVHSILKRLDFSVEIEPDFPGTEQKIDFLAHSLEFEDQSVYVEATVCGFERDVLLNSNERDALAKITKHIPSPHSDIWLEKKGSLDKTLGKQDVVKPFQDLLDSHTPDEVRRIHFERGLHDSLSDEIREGDWVLKGTLRPPPGGTLGGKVLSPARFRSHTLETIDGPTPFSEAVQKKAKKWRKLDFGGIPFLIAVNVCDDDFALSGRDEIIISQALFKESDSLEQSGNFQKSLSHVNGVFIFTRAVIGNEIEARVQLYRNGDAPIPERLLFIQEEQKLGDLLGIES